MIRARILLALAGVACLVLSLSLAPAAAAKKKSGKAKVFTQTVTPNVSVPEAPATGKSSPLLSTIVVGKKFKGKRVADLNLVGLQTTGSAAGAANDMTGYLIAPNGRTFQLFFAVGDQSLGPWTLDDDSPVSICNAPAATQCIDPNQSLNQPFSGTSNVLNNWLGFFPENGTLDIFTGVLMRGTWTLLLSDNVPPPGNGTSVLNQWGLQIRAAK